MAVLLISKPPPVTVVSLGHAAYPSFELAVDHTRACEDPVVSAQAVSEAATQTPSTRDERRSTRQS
jgi:hypothetical protein